MSEELLGVVMDDPGLLLFVGVGSLVISATVYAGYRIYRRLRRWVRRHRTWNA